MLLEEQCPFIDNHIAPQRLFDAVNMVSPENTKERTWGLGLMRFLRAGWRCLGVC